MALYKLAGVQRSHGTSTVLDIDHLTIQAGLIYTLVGPNGAGKTTLLKILAFLDRPSTGRLLFADREVMWQEGHLLPLRRRVVLLDQYPIMFSGSVAKNVEYGLKVRGVAQPERSRRTAEALAMVGMEDFAGQQAKSLSGGENKRVALARALVLRPEVLLCDEPTANVDSENQEIILRILAEMNRSLHTSIIFSTHYLSQGQRLAHHSLMLQQGRLSVTVGDNTFRVTVMARNPAGTACRLGEQLLFTLPANLVPASVAVCKLHLNPERILLNPGPCPEEEGTRLQGEVVKLARQGELVRLVIDVGVRLVVLQTMARYRQGTVRLGDRVNLLVPVAAITCESIDPQS